MSEPSDFERHLSLARRAWEQGDHSSAWDHFQILLDLEPAYLPAWVMLGNLALLAPEPELAIRYFRHARSLAPAETGICLSLAQAQRALGQYAEAAASLERYLQDHREDADAWLLLARTWKALYWTRHEAACLERYLALRPDDARVRRWLGMVRFYFGDWDWLKAFFEAQLLKAPPPRNSAEAAVRRLLELDYQRLLFTDPQVDDQALFAWIRRCHQSEPAQTRRQWPSRGPGPLRVGYLSGEFGNFASALLVWPLYAHHSERVEMFVYDDTPPQDEVAHFRPARLRWRRIHDLDDQSVVDRIQADRIDVLVDLTGITHQKRQGVYAAHPAPAQISGLGFVFSSALACMDYCFSDKVLCPPHIEALYPERVIHLTSAFHWQTPEAWLVGEPPVLRTGRLTLGAAHTLNRLQPQVIALWARLLQALPEADLFLKTAVLADPDTQKDIRARFVAHGIDGSRLRLEGHGSGHHVEYFYPQIDIALDPFPYSGGVTTSEALWMGVPVAVMDQPQWRSRALSVSIYHTLGLAGWLARSEDEYLARVVSWAQDRDFLATQRSSLRPRLLSSPICDGPAYAAEVEEAYYRIRDQASI